MIAESSLFDRVTADITVAHADGDPDIHILNNLNNVGAIEVNAFQSHCDVAIQKSTLATR